MVCRRDSRRRAEARAAVPRIVGVALQPMVVGIEMEIHSPRFVSLIKERVQVSHSSLFVTRDFSSDLSVSIYCWIEI